MILLPSSQPNLSFQLSLSFPTFLSFCHPKVQNFYLLSQSLIINIIHILSQMTSYYPITEFFSSKMKHQCHERLKTPSQIPKQGDGIFSRSHFENNSNSSQFENILSKNIFASSLFRRQIIFPLEYFSYVTTKNYFLIFNQFKIKTRKNFLVSHQLYSFSKSLFTPLFLIFKHLYQRFLSISPTI